MIIVGDAVEVEAHTKEVIDQKLLKLSSLGVKLLPEGTFVDRLHVVSTHYLWPCS